MRSARTLRTWCGCLAVGLLLALGSSAGAREMLANGGLEELQDGRPGQWTFQGPANPVQEARSGQGAVALTPGGGMWQCFSISPGQVYHASLWARGTGELRIGFNEYKGPGGSGYQGGTGVGVPLAPSWRQIHLYWSQDPTRPTAGGLGLALGVRGEGARAVVDDLSVEEMPFVPPGPNLVLNPDFLDPDADGIPRDWQGEPRRLRLEALPGDRRALRCDLRLFSEDYLPPPDFAGWWDWQTWGVQHGSGWPPLPRPLGGAYTCILTSAPTPVDPGRRYDLRVLTRELEVWGEFLAVRWWDANHQPVAEFEERISYEYYQHGHTGDWSQYVGRVTSPQEARYASLVVGAFQGGGTLWIAQPELVAAAGAPERHEPRCERLPAGLQQGRPTPVPAAQVQTEVSPPPQPGVQVSATEITVAFPNGVGLRLPLRNGDLVGITDVTVNGTALRSPRALPMAPLVETFPLRNYVNCRFRDWTRRGEEVALHSVLVTPEGEEDRLDWVLAPVTESLGGRQRTGLRYAYRFESEAVKVRRIMDRSTWEVGGTAQGLQVGADLRELGPASAFCLGWGHRFVSAESFDYETGPAGCLVIYPERYSFCLGLRQATPDFVILQDTFIVQEAAQAATVPKVVLFSPQPGGADDWAQVRDELLARYRRQLGAPPEPPLKPGTLLLMWDGLRSAPGLVLEEKQPAKSVYYRWLADVAVPRLQQLGIKRTMLCLGQMLPWAYPQPGDINAVDPEAREAFKYLADSMHRHGLELICWFGTAQNLATARIWEEHPEWWLRKEDGTRAGAYYSPWGWPGNLPAGYGTYVLNWLAEVKREIGADGLWMDSYASGQWVECEHNQMVRQAEAFLPWHAAIEGLGYVTYCEGGPFGLGFYSTGGWLPPEDPSRLKVETLYKRALYLQQGAHNENQRLARFLADPEGRYYYRMLANMCVPLLDLGIFDKPEDIEYVGQCNRDYNAVCDLMEKRRLLGDRGVEWLGERGRAIFAFRDLDYALPAGWHLQDVTTGQAMEVPPGGRLRLQQWHTYRLTAP